MYNGKTAANVVENREPTGRILVVDDESVVCDVVAGILSNAGYEVQQTESAGEALRRFSNSYFDCVVSDIRMPGMDGIELLKRARKIDSDLEVVLMTGLADAATAIAALKMGVSDYVVKPFDIEEIVHCVTRAVEHRRLTIENREYQQQLEQKVDHQAGIIRRQFLSSIQSLAKAIEARDPYTHGHSDRVSALAGRIAEHLGVVPDECDMVVMAGLLHDIGKIGVPDTILRKHVGLDASEWKVMQTHVATGRDIVIQMQPPPILVEGILHHHERWDGHGYPDGKAGTEIPLVARILAAADAYDAMTSMRPYRDAYSEADAITKLEECRGIQVDPAVVDAMLDILGGSKTNFDPAKAAV